MQDNTYILEKIEAYLRHKLEEITESNAGLHVEEMLPPEAAAEQILDGFLEGDWRQHPKPLTESDRAVERAERILYTLFGSTHGLNREAFNDLVADYNGVRHTDFLLALGNLDRRGDIIIHPDRSISSNIYVEKE